MTPATPESSDLMPVGADVKQRRSGRNYSLVRLGEAGAGGSTG